MNDEMESKAIELALTSTALTCRLTPIGEG